MKLFSRIAAFTVLSTAPMLLAQAAEPQPPPAWVLNFGEELQITTSDTSSAIAAAPDSTLYLAGGSLSAALQGSAGGLCAITPEGAVDWIYKVPRGAMNHGPLVMEDGTILVTATIYQTNPLGITGTLFAITPGGTLDWKFERPRSLGSPAVASDGSIWVTSHTNLFALEPNGDLRHQIDLGGSGGNFSTFLAIGADDIIYAGTDDGRFLAYGLQGALLWEAPIPVLPRLRPAIGNDGSIYISDGASREVWGGRLIALNRDGSLQWEYPASAPLLGSPVVGTEGTIYVVTEAGDILALNPDGTLQWRYSSGVSLRSSPVIDQEGNLCLPGSANSWFALSPEGEVITETTIATANVPPILTASGRLYFLQGFQLVAHDLGHSFHPSSWPMSGASPAQTSRSLLTPPEPAGDLPQITETFPPASIPVGEELILSVSATSTEPLAYEWRRNGQPLPGETNATLEIAAVTLADAGEYSLALSNPAGTASTPLTRITILPDPPALLLPVAVTGWNLDVVREAAPPHTAYAFSDFPPGNLLEAPEGSSWFESGYQDHADGLPSARRIVSTLNSETYFEPQPYTANNVLKLNTFAPTASLALTEPARYRYLAVLAASTLSGGGIGEIILHFSDDTSSGPLPLYAPEWNTLDPLLALGNLSAVSRRGGTDTVYRDFEHGFGLFQTDLDLQALGLHQKELTRISFTKPGGTARPYITGIFAVSGLRFQESPTLAQPQLTAEGMLQISVQNAPAFFTVETSSDLLTWETAENTTILPSGAFLIDPASSNQQFYRISIPPFQP